MDRVTPGKTEAVGKAFVDELNKAVWTNGEDSLRALEELSGIAMGGHEKARELVNAIDNAVEVGDLVLARPSEQTKNPSKFREALFVARHPVISARAKVRQFAVSIEHQAPPHTSTYEKFPELPISMAARALRAAEENHGKGIPKGAWSKKDQNLMKKGDQPQGYPEHPNV